MQLGPVKSLSPPALFDHHVGDVFHSFVGGETALAVQTFPSPANHIAFFTFTGIDYSILAMITKWTAHDR